MAGVWGAEPLVRSSGGKAPEAVGILISHDKNKIETEKINSNRSQLEKIGAGAK